MDNLKREQLKEVIKANKSKFMTVRFIKKNGEERKMNCMKRRKDGSPTTAHKENLVTMWDLQAQDWRCVNLDTTTYIKAGGKTYTYNVE